MMNQIVVSIILCFLSTIVVSEEISITLKPTKKLVGTRSINIHEDGNVTLLVYKSPSKISEESLIIDTAAINDLKNMASITLDEYMLLKRFSQIKTYTLLAGIIITRDSVTKNISSRKLTENMIELISKINNYLPEEHRVEVVAK